MHAVKAADGEEGVTEADDGDATAAEVHGLYHGPLVRDGVVLFGGAEALQAREPSGHVHLTCP